MVSSNGSDKAVVANGVSHAGDPMVSGKVVLGGTVQHVVCPLSSATAGGNRALLKLEVDRSPLAHTSGSTA